LPVNRLVSQAGLPWLGGEAGRLTSFVEPLTEVEAPEVEGELEPEHAEEALDVIGGLRDRVRDDVMPLARISSNALKPPSSRSGIVKL
jgi:hypothetical protein